MSSGKFKLVSVFFKLSSTLKQELGRDMSRKVVAKTKCHYKELDKLKPKEKGIMRFHRLLSLLPCSKSSTASCVLFFQHAVIDLSIKIYVDIPIIQCWCPYGVHLKSNSVLTGHTQ